MKKSKLIRPLALLLCLVALLGCFGCSHEHVFGDWQAAGENGHQHSCTKCEQTDLEPHTFVGPTIDKAATASEGGTVRYTCSVCGWYYTEETEPLVKIELREIETWDIHTSLQKKFLADKPDNVLNYAKGTSELSYPQSLTFNWEAIGLDDTTLVLDHYEYAISEHEDMSDAIVSTCRWNDYSKSNGSQNLKIRTKYYWQVTAILTDGQRVQSKISSFTTLEGPRNLYIAGVANVRDLGGKDCDGGVLRQDLIFRCGRLHENYSPEQTLKISKAGIKSMLEMGIVCEIDLRGKIKDGVVENGSKADGSFTVTKSVLGDSVKYFNPGAEYSNTMVNTPAGKKMVKDTFAILADPANYPLIFHCSIGTDRTGIIAILVEGVCGVDKTVIYQDYLFSNFGNIGSSRDHERWDAIMTTIVPNGGSTFMEQCRKTLIKCGVTEEQIEAVRSILIEKTAG